MTASATDDRAHHPDEDPGNPIADQMDERAAPESPLAALSVHRIGDSEQRDAARVSSAPDVIGLAVLDAHAVVRKLGLRLAASVWETKLGPWGLILSQRPEPGARIRIGARIHAVVAGRPHRAVPDVRGQRLDVAIDALRRNGLVPVVTSERASRTMDAGTVVSSRPSAGALIVDGSRVSLAVSRGQPHRDDQDGRRPAG
jgi:beta-lactam-binding protein with PASTA domain